MSGWRQERVIDLQRAGVILVEDGNHGENRPLKNEFTDQGVPFIRPPDLQEGRVNFDSADRINATALARIRKGIGRGGDILFSHRATVGRMARASYDAPKFVTNPGVTIYRCLKPEILCRDFLYFWMQSAFFMDQVWAIAGGSDTFPYASLSEQRKLKISIPAQDEQREIAAILGALDDKIELNRKTAAALEEMARALYRSWFVDFDPVRARAEGRAAAHVDPATGALFPDSFGEDGLPVGWKLQPFTDQIEILSGGTPKTSEPSFWGGDIPWYSVVDAPAAGQVFVHSTEKTITAEGLSKSPARIVPRGTTILSARGTVGKLAIAPCDMAFNQSCYGLRGRYRPLDAFTYFSALWVVDQLRSMAHGSVFATITRQTFEGLQLPSATPEIMDAFESKAAALLNRIDSFGQENRTLAALRDTLLPRLMSGELRVGTARELLEEVA